MRGHRDARAAISGVTNIYTGGEDFNTTRGPNWWGWSRGARGHVAAPLRQECEADSCPRGRGGWPRARARGAGSGNVAG